ncbi:MAG: hypothetical protein A2Y07_05475 [Planctomycetes bacterium GWF2_50_10]|nr:MAG: hypothetical protein A2Y07_05475 [Planctomycetes bacterium GWF2_50_10]
MLNGTEARIREVLIDVACRKTKISYGQLNSEVPLHLDLKMPTDKAFLGHLLSIISKYEHSQNRPLLAALVTNGKGSQKGNPDKSFFELAQELGRFDSETDKTPWLEFEQKLIYEQWENGSA